MKNIDLKNLIIKVFNNYPFNDKTVPLKDNDTANSIRSGIDNINDIDNNLISKGFPGLGKWSTVPGIAVLNKNITHSTQKGIYVTYLFSANGKQVYLSLNQGWKMFNKNNTKKDARHKIQKKASILRGTLSYSNSKINDIPINLNSKKDNPVGYELGNILSIKYDKNSLPSNDILIKDLIDMIQIFNSLISKLHFNNKGEYEFSNYYIDIIKRQNKITDNNLKITNVKYKKVKTPEDTNNYTIKNNKKGIIKKDYERSNKIKTMIGEYGENIVIKIEEDKLINLNRKDLAEKIEHVSKTQGDGLGYDIKSFDKNGNVIYIEVKSTTGDYRSEFNISSNELNVANEKFNKNESYKIYRLYDIQFNSNKNDYDVKYYIIEGNLNEKLRLSATSYIATPK